MGKRKDILRAFQLEISEAMRKNKHSYKTMLKRVENKIHFEVPLNEHESCLEFLVMQKWSSRNV